MNNKGTIVYIGGFEMPDRNAAAHRVLNNARIFKEIGYNVVFCGIDKTITSDCNEPFEVDGFDSYPSAYPQNKKQWVKSLLDFTHIKTVIDKYDDVRFAVAYNMHAKPLSELLRYCHKRGIKVIADITEWYGNGFSINPIKFVRWYDTNEVMTRLHKKVDGIISISTYFSDYYKNFVKSVVQLPPLVDFQEDIWQTGNNLKNDSVVEFVYTGSPGRDKDKINLIINCFCECNQFDFKFRIIGITKEQFITDYPDYAEKIEILGHKIEFAGRISHKDSILALKNADYCIFIRDPSRKNMAGFPTKFVECVSSGVGIIANEVSNIKDYFPKDGKSILIRDTDIDEICRAIEQAIKSDIDKIRDSRKSNDEFDYRGHISCMNEFLVETFR